jgi:hypothetical protein
MDVECYFDDSSEIESVSDHADQPSLARPQPSPPSWTEHKSLSIGNGIRRVFRTDANAPSAHRPEAYPWPPEGSTRDNRTIEGDELCFKHVDWDLEAVFYYKSLGNDGPLRTLVTSQMTLEVLRENKECPMCFIILAALGPEGDIQEAASQFRGEDLVVVVESGNFGAVSDTPRTQHEGGSHEVGHHRYEVNRIIVGLAERDETDETDLSRRRTIPKDLPYSHGIQLLAPGIKDNGPESDLLFGRPMSPAEVNFDLLEEWISCKPGMHCGACTPDQMTFNFSFRLIDVKEKCIVPASSRNGYVALSYVWGNVPQTLLTKNSHHKLATSGCLADPELGVPQTILDAMQVCHRLNRRYLWVDALCITQDDDNDKEAQIWAMDRIYCCAEFTIVVNTPPSE